MRSPPTPSPAFTWRRSCCDIPEQCRTPPFLQVFSFLHPLSVWHVQTLSSFKSQLKTTFQQQLNGEKWNIVYLSAFGCSVLVWCPVFERMLAWHLFSLSLGFDYCNVILAGFSQVLLHKIQTVIDCSARLVCKAPKSAHITPLLLFPLATDQ